MCAQGVFQAKWPQWAQYGLFQIRWNLDEMHPIRKKKNVGIKTNTREKTRICKQKSFVFFVPDLFWCVAQSSGPLKKHPVCAVLCCRLQAYAKEARREYSELGSKDISELKSFVKVRFKRRLWVCVGDADCRIEPSGCVGSDQRFGSSTPKGAKLSHNCKS